MDFAFLTLFLGLTSGIVPLEFSASPDIGAIELQLDGKVVSRLTEPPWNTSLDLGADLLPHDLVARALDLDNSELARAEQWVNLPRPPAELQILIEPALGNAPRTVRLSWRSVTNAAATDVSLSLDGSKLPLDAEHRAVLPHPVGGSTHVLSAQVRFGSLSARKDAVLGGDFSEVVATDLTGFAVKVAKSELPAAAQLSGWFTGAGRPLTVSGVESGPPHLIVVREPGVAERAVKLGWVDLPRSRFRMPKGGRVRLLSTLAEKFEGSSVTSELFESSQEFDPAELGLPGLLARVVHAEGETVRTADAVAVAGAQADLVAGPRAVLLVLGAVPLHDASRYSGPNVRRFLAALHVPLYVWCVGPPSAALQDVWGVVDDASTRHGLDHAFDRMMDELARQRVVLVEGKVLPQTIAVQAGHGVEMMRTP
jgi:hypothetical protein